jgi:hypothetical protein
MGGAGRPNKSTTICGARERAENAVRSLAPRSAAERGEGWGEGPIGAPLTRTRLLRES